MLSLGRSFNVEQLGRRCRPLPMCHWWDDIEFETAGPVYYPLISIKISHDQFAGLRDLTVFQTRH